MDEETLRKRLEALDLILDSWAGPEPCACMGPQNDDPLCPCAMSFAAEKSLRRARDMTLWALARITKDEDAPNPGQSRQ